MIKFEPIVSALIELAICSKFHVCAEKLLFKKWTSGKETLG